MTPSERVKEIRKLADGGVMNWSEFTFLLERVERLEKALVNAAVPLEALMMLGASYFGYQSWIEITSAVKEIRQALEGDEGQGVEG